MSRPGIARIKPVMSQAHGFGQDVRYRRQAENAGSKIY